MVGPPSEIDLDCRQWQPEFAVPKVMVRGFPEAGLVVSDGLALSRWLIENAHEIDIPASDPSILVDSSGPEAEIYRSRYTGPNIFSLPEHPAEITGLHALYQDYMVKVWREEFGLQVKPYGLDGRAAEAFITNSAGPERNDPHVDTQMVCAGYPAPGAALVVSHCTNSRNIEDIEAHAATLVLPGAQSLVFFPGTQHPHIGISPNIDRTDSSEMKQAKFQSLFERFHIVDLALPNSAQQTSKPDPLESLDPDAILDLLVRWPELSGDRIVLSFNFREPDSETSFLDGILV